MMEEVTKVVLLVDDEVNILNSLKRLLRKEDYKVITALDGEEALAVVKKRVVNIVLSDFRMPGMTGVELLQKVKEISPDTVRVVLSGYADVASIVESINKGEIYRFLAKPWNDEELKVNIRQCMEYYDIVCENNHLLGRIQVQNEKLKELNETLEERVEERTFLLKMSQELLEIVPIPILGVDSEGRVIIMNEAVRTNFPEFEKVLLGSEMEQVLPLEAVIQVKKCLKGEETASTRCNWLDREVLVDTEIARNCGEIRGCLVVLNTLAKL